MSGASRSNIGEAGDILETPTARRANYTDVMVDLETVGTAPGSGIIAVGAVAFAPGMPERDWRNFEVPVISRASCRQIGLTEDQDTLVWWEKQDKAARWVYDTAQTRGDHIVWALTEFAVEFFPSYARLWGNGADFDVVLLGCAYRAVGMRQPWKYGNSRCFRTMKNEHPSAPEPAFQGVRHNALADALHQARWLQAIWQDMRDRDAAYEEWNKAVKEVVKEKCQEYVGEEEGSTMNDLLG